MAPFELHVLFSLSLFLSETFQHSSGAIDTPAGVIGRFDSQTPHDQKLFHQGEDAAEEAARRSHLQTVHYNVRVQSTLLILIGHFPRPHNSLAQSSYTIQAHQAGPDFVLQQVAHV